MLTTLFIIALICALTSGIFFFQGTATDITRNDKIAAGLLGISAMLLLILAYIAGAK
jgi:hypothetical protein